MQRTAPVDDDMRVSSQLLSVKPEEPSIPGVGAAAVSLGTQHATFNWTDWRRRATEVKTSFPLTAVSPVQKSTIALVPDSAGKIENGFLGIDHRTEILGRHVRHATAMPCTSGAAGWLLRVVGPLARPLHHQREIRYQRGDRPESRYQRSGDHAHRGHRQRYLQESVPAFVL